MLITNAKIITWEDENRILENHALYIKDGIIADIGSASNLEKSYPNANKIDADNQYVMPGNICAHTHFYGAYARGLAIPGAAPSAFPEILEKLWWPLDKSLDEESVKYSALVMLVDAIKHGTTCLIDHHASPGYIEGSLDTIADAVDQSGLRAMLCYEVTDRNGSDGTVQGITENTRFIKRVESDNIGGRIAASFGLHASLTLSDSTLDACKEAVPDGYGFHIHVAEHEADQYDSIAKSGKRVVERLSDHGILGDNSIVAHAVHINAREAAILEETGTWVTHQPRSNMNNAVGVADIESLLHMGVPVCMGTDGFSSTMWSEWKNAYLIQKLWHKDPRRMNGSDVIKMGVYNNASLATRMFRTGPLGVISPGANADLIFVDYHPYTPMTSGNLPWHILFGFHESMVTTTIAAGKILMRNRQLVTLDEEEITSKAAEIAPALWERYQEQFN